MDGRTEARASRVGASCEGKPRTSSSPEGKHAECREPLSSFVVEVERVKEDYRTRGRTRDETEDSRGRTARAETRRPGSQTD